MQCERVREQFTDHVTQGVAEPLPPTVVDHLSSCPSCRAEVDELQGMWGSLGAIRVPEPGTDARARFDLMVNAYEQGLDQGVAQVPSQQASPSVWKRFDAWVGSWWPRQPAMQFGLTLLLLTVGIAAGRGLVGGSPSSADLKQSNEIAELRGELSGMKQIVAISLLQQQSASARLRGVNWSYELGQPGQEVLTALVDTLTRDPNVNVRLASVDALRQYSDRPVVRKGMIDAMVHQEYPMVQVALIDFAVDLGDPASTDMLRRLTEDEMTDVLVRERALKALAQLK